MAWASTGKKSWDGTYELKNLPRMHLCKLQLPQTTPVGITSERAYANPEAHKLCQSNLALATEVRLWNLHFTLLFVQIWEFSFVSADVPSKNSF